MFSLAWSNRFKDGDYYMGQWFEHNNRQRSKIVAVLGGMAAVCVGLCSPPAQAARLQFWRYSPAQNRLEFTTDEMVRPQVQIIPNPVRLVIDLPGVKLNQPKTAQTYNAAVRSIRVGQFDAQTARIVVELAPGYTVDPSQVKVSSSSPSSWAVDLPTPVAVSPSPENATTAATPEAAIATMTSPVVPPSTSAAPLESGAPVTDTSVTRTPITRNPPVPSLAERPLAAAPSGSNVLDDILVTPDGLFLKTPAAINGVDVRRRSREISIKLNGVVVSKELTQNDYQMSYHGIQKISIRQLSAQPPVAQLTLQVARRSPNWIASTSRFGSLILLPEGGAAAVPNGRRPSSNVSILGKVQTASVVPSTASSGSFGTMAEVQSVALGGSQLLIRSNRAVVYTSGWEGSQYRITVQRAQAAQGLRTPQTGIGSPLSSVTLRQDGRNLSILVTPALGVRISTISRMGSQTAVLGLTRGGSNSVFSQTLPQTYPQTFPQASSVFSPPTLPNPTGRRVVVIDPGHGGTDPGAIGIGGLRETEITLHMSQEVARLLQEKGLQVYLTRSDESREVDLPPRVALAQRVRADVFVSIHANSINMSRPDINGAMAFYAPGSASGGDLSQTILNSIVRNVNIPSRGTHSARFYVVRHTSMPATLVETGFVTGAQDAPKLADPNFRRQMAAAIAQGIIEYLNRR
jgi:N-acetylmuramoyl-L-alanine amidase